MRIGLLLVALNGLSLSGGIAIAQEESGTGSDSGADAPTPLELTLARLEAWIEELAGKTDVPERTSLIEGFEQQLEDLRSCESRGGWIQPFGDYSWCVMPYSDAGKQCSDSSECEGWCIIETEARLEPGPTTGGMCQSETPIVASCYARVTDGIIGTTYCN